MRYTILIAVFMLSFSAHANTIIRGQGLVNYVVDGDTMDIRVPVSARQELLDAGYVSPEHISERFGTFRVRLANVDTEESVHEDDSRNSAAGDASSSDVRSQILRKNAEYSCWQRGHYGRAVCSLNVDGVGDLGLYLIETGQSPYVTGFGRHPYLDSEYRQAERTAKSNSSGSRSRRLSDVINGIDTSRAKKQLQERANDWWNN